jgi:putative MATE family efflux protein
MIIGVALTLPFSIVALVIPQHVLSLAGASETVAAAGSSYLALTSLSLLPMIIGSVLSSVLRSTDRPRSPMIATMVTVVLNTVLGYMLVYGTGPLPEMGIVGVGVSTLLTAFLKTFILYYQAFVKHSISHWNRPNTWAEFREVIKPLFVLALPMGITEFVWTIGLYLYNVILQRLGDLPLAAGQIANTLEGIFIVASIGLMTAGQTLVSRSVGANDPTAAERWIKVVKAMSLKTSFIFAAIYSCSALLIPFMYENAGDEVRKAAAISIIINALFQPFRVRNMVLGGAVLPSASDMKGIIIGDAFGALVVGIPMAALLGLFTPLALFGVMIARGLDEIGKVCVYTWRSRRINWTAVAAEHS